MLKPFRGAMANRAHPQARKLLASWLFNEGMGNKLFDSSGNNNHGTLTNMNTTTDWIGSPDGGALDFDGGNDSVLINGNFNLTDNFTLSAKIYPRTPTNSDWAGVIDKFDRWSTGYAIAESSSGGWRFIGYTTSSGWFSVNFGTVSVDNWHVLEATMKNGIIKTYKDGVFMNTLDRSGETIKTNALALKIGRQSTDYYNGKVSRVSIWNDALSAADISQNNFNPYAMYDDRPSLSRIFTPTIVGTPIPVFVHQLKQQEIM